MTCADQPDQALGEPCLAQDVAAGYAADWALAQLRENIQRIADRIDEMIEAGIPAAGPLHPTG